MARIREPGVGRPPSFTREELVAVALERGPNDLNFTEIAKALGVPRTTVHNHARNPEALGRLVLQFLYDQHPWPTPPRRPRSWQRELEAFAASLREMALAAGAWAKYGSYDAHLSQAMLLQVDRLAAILLASGFTRDDAGLALELINNVAVDTITAEANDYRSAPKAARFVSRLDPAAFPNLTSLGVAQIAGDDPATTDRHFRSKVRVVIAGIETVLLDGRG